MNMNEVFQRVKELEKLKQEGLRHPEHSRTIDRASKSRVVNLPTHMRYFASCHNYPSLEAVDATLLTRENIHAMGEWLKREGKKEDTVVNAKSNLTYLAEVAEEMGIVFAKAPIIARAKKHQVSRRGNGKLAPRRMPVYEPYALAEAAWPQHLHDELVPIKDFLTNKYAEHRTKRIYRPTSYEGWKKNAARFFGYCLQAGIPTSDLSFKLYCDLDLFKGYRRFQLQRRNRDTMTAEGELHHVTHLVRNFFLNPELADKMSRYMSTVDFETTRSKYDLIERISPEDCYTVLFGLAGEAMHYEANLRRKYGRSSPEAIMASHYHKAAAYGYTLLTVRRELNVCEATRTNIFKKDGAWSYAYEGHQMKNGLPSSDHVIDLWAGKETEQLVHYLLDRAVELRPILVAHLKSRTPLEIEPEAFFLNRNGKAFSDSGLRGMFYSETVRYLGLEKEFGPHALRKIIPTNLCLREGPEIIPAIMSMLDHTSFQTTEKYYLAVQQRYSTKLARLKMEEKTKANQRQEYLFREVQHISKMLAELKGRQAI